MQKSRLLPSLVLPVLLIVLVVLTGHEISDTYWRSVEQKKQSNVDVDSIATLIDRHAESFTTALYAARSLLSISPDLGAKEWGTYVQGLDTFRNLEGVGATVIVKRVDGAHAKQFLTDLHQELVEYSPGIQDFTKGFVPANRDYYFVTYAEPVARAGVGIGFDFSSEEKRAEALRKSIARNQPVATARLNAVGSGTPVFIVSLPLYRLGKSSDTEQDRAANAIGVVNVGIRSADFFKSVIKESNTTHAIHVLIFDGEKMNSESLMFDSIDAYTVPDAAALKKATMKTINFFSREWTLVTLPL